MMNSLWDVKQAVEQRLINDYILDNISDELLIESMENHMAQLDDENISIISLQLSNIDWVMEKLLIPNIHDKNVTTVQLAIGIIKVVNNLKYSKQDYELKAKLYNKFTKLCAAIIHGPPLLLSMVKTLKTTMNHLNMLKGFKEIILDAYTVSECVSTAVYILTLFEDVVLNRPQFKKMFGAPDSFCKQMNSMIMELRKLSQHDMHDIFMALFETIMVIIDTANRKIEYSDWSSTPCELPFTAMTLMCIIFKNKILMDYLTKNMVKLFSTSLYIHDPIRLVSAVFFIYRLSCSKRIKKVDIIPALKVLHSSLTTAIDRTLVLTDLDPGENSHSEFSMYEFPSPVNIMSVFSKGNNLVAHILHGLDMELNDLLVE